MKMEKKNFIHLGISVILFALIQFCLPLVYGLTPEGRSFLSVLIPMVYLWITVDTFVCSMLALAMMGIMQVLPSSTILANSIGNSSLAILLFANLLIGAVGASGALKKVTQWFISRKVIVGHPYRFFLLLGLACFILAALISATYTILAVIPIANEICESMNYKRHSKFKNAALLFSMWSCIAGGIAFPFGKITYITLLTTLGSFDIALSFADIFPYAFAVGVLWFFLGLAVVKFILRPELDQFNSYNPELILADMQANPLSKQGKLLSIGFLMMILLWVLSSFSDRWSFAAYLDAIGYHFIAAAIFAVLCIVQIDNAPVINIRETFAKNNWSIFIFGAMITFCSSMISNSAFGIKDFLIGIMGPAFDSVSPIAMFIIAIVLTAVMTNFTSNLVTLVVICTVFIPLLQAQTGSMDMGVALAVAVSFVAGMGCVTPAACPCAALVLDGENTTIKSGLAANITMMVLGTLLSVGISMLI